MLFSADYVRDPHIVVVDNRRQMVETRSVGPHDHVILLGRPLETDVASYQIGQDELAFARHLESNDSLPAFRLVSGRVGVALGHPATAVGERYACLLGLLSLGLNLLSRGKIAIGGARPKQCIDGSPVFLGALRLVVGAVRASNLGTLVPVQAQPTQTVQDRPQGLVDVALLVGIVHAKDELPIPTASKKPVE